MVLTAIRAVVNYSAKVYSYSSDKRDFILRRKDYPLNHTKLHEKKRKLICLFFFVWFRGLSFLFLTMNRPCG